MNKYQEALDFLDRLTITHNNGLEMHEQQVEILQELIEDYQSYQEGYELLLKEKWKLEKALDKAIKTLTELDHEMYKDDNCQMSEKDWKEWLLKDE